MPIHFNTDPALPAICRKRLWTRRLRKLTSTWGIAAALASVPAQADVVSDWAELQTAIDKAVNGPMGNFDPKLFQAFSRVDLAMFEAANSVDPKYQSYLKLPRAPAGASSVAAVATAAHNVMISLYPAHTDKLDQALTLTLADIPSGIARNNGIAAGKAAAVAAIAAGGINPSLPKGTYRPTAPVGKWSASGVPFPSEIVTFRPWFLLSASQFRLPPPPALTSKAFADSYNETKSVGAKNSMVRTTEQTLNAKFFVDYQIDPMMRQVASMPGRSIVRNARFYALMAMAGEDDYIIMADGKMAHMFWRPLNAIRTGDADDNERTVADPDWEPLVRTPAQPEYPCGHCGFSMVVATITAAEGPPPPGGYRFISDNLDGLSRSFSTMAAYAKAASDSRIEAGVHWRLTNDATNEKAEAFAKMAIAKFAPPLK